MREKKRVSLILFVLIFSILLTQSIIMVNVDNYRFMCLQKEELDETKYNSISNISNLSITNSLFGSRGTLIDIEQSDPRANQFMYNHTVYDANLFKYLAIEQIHKDLIEGTTGFNPYDTFTIGVVDNLIDFKHPNLNRLVVANDQLDWEKAVSTVVLINNQEATGSVQAYKEITDLSIENPYDKTTDHFGENTRFYDYLHVGQYGHGTAVAGIINQIAPGNRIISIAFPQTSTVTQLYHSLMNLMSWIKNRGANYKLKIINISNRWGAQDLELTQSQKNDIEDEIESILKSENNKITFVASAGNNITREGQPNIIYPSHLADNWEDDFKNYYGDSATISNKIDYDDNAAIATGFISTSAVFCSGSQIGLREEVFPYVYDEDMDNTGDLKLMAPGFFIRTTTNTFNVTDYPHSTNQTDFSGTSAAAPVISGIAALLISRNSNLKSFEIEKKLTENAVYDSNIILTNPELL